MKKKFILLTVVLICLIVSGCGKKVYFNDYISECKYNTLEGASGSYAVRVNQTKKETPYIADGKCGNVRSLMEIFLTADDNTAEYEIYFEHGGRTYGGELNFNSVRQRHELSFEFAEAPLQSIDLILTAGEESVEITAETIISAQLLSPSAALEKLYAAKKEVFDTLNAGGAFKAEVHIRLLDEDGKCYYYVGIVTQSGKIHAFLLNAEDGSLIAQKEIDYRANIS